MTHDELAHVARVLGVRLPEAYCRWMQAYPFDLYSPQAQHELPNNAIGLLEANRELRRDVELGFRWHDHYFAFGATEDGDPLFVNTSLNPSPVYRADRLTCKILVEAASFEHWIAERLPADPPRQA